MSEDDRREFRRVLVDINCNVTLPNGVKISGTAKNLSMRGLFVESSFPLTKGTEVTINFDVIVNGQLKSIEAMSQIEHRATRISLGEYGIGLHFTEIDEEALKHISTYILDCPPLH